MYFPDVESVPILIHLSIYFLAIFRCFRYGYGSSEELPASLRRKRQQCQAVGNTGVHGQCKYALYLAAFT